MLNLQSLRLPEKEHFGILNLLHSHKQSDLTDFETDLILYILNYELEEHMESIKYSLDDIAIDVRRCAEQAHEAAEDAALALQRSDDCEKMLRESALMSMINNKLISIEQSYGEMSALVKQHAKSEELIAELIPPLLEVLDFLDSRKNLNIRKPKECPKSAILNLRKISKNLKNNCGVE